MAPRVSVITATYNQGRYLAESIDSALSQSGVEVEVIVVDDASTDDTTEILSRYGNRIRVIRLPENCGGPARPRNLGFKAATGDYLAILDGDDVMLPGRLAEQVALLEANPEISFVCANFRNFDESSTPEATDELSTHEDFQKLPKARIGDRWYRLPPQGVYETLIGDNFIGVATVMFRRSVLESVGFFDESLKRSEDIEYWYRIARVCTFGYVDAVMAGRRLHGTNISASPAALAAKLEIYRRQETVPMLPGARRMLRRMMAKIHYSLGYMDRQRGHRLRAARRFLVSLSYDFNGGRALVSVVAALFGGCPGPAESPDGTDEISSRSMVVAMAVVVAVAAFIRCYRIASRGLWMDEIDLWLGSLCDWRSNQAAPLAFWIYGAWLRFSGGITSEVGLHVPSVVFGSLAVVPVYLLGKQMFDRRTGLLAAVLMAFSPMAIYYSQEARPYALFLNLVALTLYFFVRARASGHLRWTVAYLVAAALSLMTHMLAGFVLMGILIWAFVEDFWDRAPRRFFPVLRATVLSGVGALWMLHRVSPVSSVVSAHFGASWRSFARVVLYSLGPEISVTSGRNLQSTVGGLVIAALAVLGVFRLKKERSGLLYSLFPLIGGIFVSVLFLTLGGMENWKWDRYLTPVLPMFLVLVAGGCLSFRGQFRKVAAGVTLAFLFAGIVKWAAWETYDRSQEQRTVSEQLALHSRDLDGFLMLAPSRMISPPVAVYALALLRTDHLPTYVLMEGGLSAVPSAPIPPVESGWVLVSTASLPAGRYLVYDWAWWSGPLTPKLAAQGLSDAQRISKSGTGFGADLYLFPSSATVRALGDPTPQR